MPVNLTTLKYIVALESYRNFVKAAEACSVSQPTLSAAIRNMEIELDVLIFDRSLRPVTPTLLGEKIIAMARKTLRDAEQIEEFIAATKGEERGGFSLGVIPTVAPYILPDFFTNMAKGHPGIKLKVEELYTEFAVVKLLNAELDAAIMSTPLGNSKLLEIPLYRENFLLYVSPQDELNQLEKVPVEKLATDRIWLLEEGHCLRNQVLNFCHFKDTAQHRYQAGSISTLIEIVDKNGGYTIVPQLHAALLSEERKRNLREIVGKIGGCADCVPNREISLVFREDYIRERMINIISDTIKTIVPEEMLDERLKKFSIRI